MLHHPQLTGRSLSTVARHAVEGAMCRTATALEPAAAGDPKSPACDGNNISRLESAEAKTNTVITKSESKKMLKVLCVCKDLPTARELAGPIMKRYMHHGKGLCKCNTLISARANG